MATYFSPSNTGNMMMYMNYAPTSGSYSDALAGNSQQPSSCADFASVAEANTNPLQEEIMSDSGESRLGLYELSAWRNGDDEMVLMEPAGGDTAHVVLQGAQNLQGQGLSLSLGTHSAPGFQMYSIQYRDPRSEFSSLFSPSQLVSGDDQISVSKETKSFEYMHPGLSNSDVKLDVSSYGILPSIARTISNSKYLKAAQQLLDEVVNVRDALKGRNSRKELARDAKEPDGANGTAANTKDSPNNELSAADKQDLQNKLSKLLSMLDEVDHRFRQYSHQLQIVVSSFDIVAGHGAAKPYTALALQTISRHFRSLRDAINSQIQATRKSLGEQDDSSNGKGISISRLRYVDQHLRQQRALQHLGIMQQHAWRPQRGLPENAVSILRAWLFEHFLHPYPKDSDKIMLARQAGLTRSQVSNWFINARVRLWKPMVEELYKEEIGDAKMDSASSAEELPKGTKSDTRVSEDRGEEAHQTATSTVAKQNHPDAYKSSDSFNFHNAYRTVTDDDHAIFADSIIHHGSSDRDRYAAATSISCHMSPGLESFGNGNVNGVSLTLGLQHCEAGRFPVSVAARHGLGAMRTDNVYSAATPSTIGPQTADFDFTGSGDRKQRFGSSCILHDFVA